MQVITPEVNRAAVITAREQVIIAGTIEEALSRYNALGKESKIAGVIVQNPAPDTSHEAGVFNAGGIAVMQVKDVSSIDKLLESNEPLIIDPQRSRIYQIPENLLNFSATKDKGYELDRDSGISSGSESEYESDNEQKDRNIKKINILDRLYDNNILAKGIYASGLSSYVTPLVYSLTEISGPKKDAVKLSGSLGTILAKAKTGNQEATKQVLSIAHDAISFASENYQPQGDDKAAKLRSSLDELGTPKMGESNSGTKTALGYVLRSMANAYKKGIISKDLFKTTMIAGAENYILLDNLEKVQNPNKETKDRILLEYFNSSKKFTGLITGAGTSLATSLAENKYKELADQLVGKGVKISEEQKGYLVESLKLSNYFINDNSKEQWQRFCANICQNDQDAKRLGALLNQVVSFALQEKWTNFIFTELNDPKEPKQTLLKLGQNFAELEKSGSLQKIKEASALIKTMESQIPLWADPAKFDELYKGMQRNLEVIHKKLKGYEKSKLDQELQEKINENKIYSKGYWFDEEALNELDLLLKNRLSQTSEESYIKENLSLATTKIAQGIDFNDKKQIIEFKNIIDTTSQKLAFLPNSSNLEKLIILEQAHKLTDVMDHSIKSLTRSNIYSNNMKSNEVGLKGSLLQAVNFGKMLIKFNEMLKNLIEKDYLPTSGDELSNNITEILNIKNSRKTYIRDNDEFSPTAKFDVRNFNVLRNDTENRYLSTVKNSFEEFFTIIHQNSLNVIAHIQEPIIKNFNKQFPTLLANLNQKLDNITNHHVSSATRLTEGSIIIEKNITLRGHSAVANIIYDNHSNDLSVQFTMVGANEDNRWDHVALDSYLELATRNVKFISSSYHDKAKEIVSFHVKIEKAEHIKLVKEVIEGSIKTSFNVDDTSIFKRYGMCKKLVTNNPELKKRINELYPITQFDPNFEELGKLAQQPELARILVTSYKKISPFLEQKILTIKDFANCNIDQLNSLIENKITPIQFEASTLGNMLKKSNTNTTSKIVDNLPLGKVTRQVNTNMDKKEDKPRPITR